jgi:hypothetical protein
VAAPRCIHKGDIILGVLNKEEYNKVESSITQKSQTIPNLNSQPNSSRIWSLLRIMKDFDFEHFCVAFSMLEGVENMIVRSNQEQTAGIPAHELEITMVILPVEKLGEICGTIGFKETAKQADRLLKYFQDPLFHNLSYPVIESRIRVLKEALFDELHGRKFLWIGTNHSDFVDQDRLFGLKVWENFPSARDDIKAAGNCIAADCNTAAVFHLMRAAEIGLRTLAWDRRVKFAKKSPLVLKQWGEIFQKLEKAETDIQSFPKTLARESQLEFYHGALVQFRAFKNLYRDRTDHARRHYDRYEAEKAFGQVADFMTILATHISEKKRTPIIWKKA